MNGHFEIVRLLIDANAEIDLPDKVYRRLLCMTRYSADETAMHDTIHCLSM